VWGELVSETFSALERLADVLLHCLALGQELVTGDANVEWRDVWGDTGRFVGLRTLVYHPGPTHKADGSKVRTTARHTDATWLTILHNDNIGGLMVLPTALDRWVEARATVQGALLVNTGNVMGRATEGLGREGQPLYPAVCHFVERTSASEKMTRVSMPFFYDRLGGHKYHAGGTGGC